MVNQMLFAGIAGGLATAIGLALVLSAVFTQSTAQMVDHQRMMGGTMGPGMTTQSTGMPWQLDQKSMFNANGMSTVNNVQITGISVGNNDEISVNLRYDGEEISPAVTVIAITSPMAMMQGSGMGGMGMMHGGQGGMMMQPMMGSGWSAPHAWQNNTQWQKWHAQMVQWHGQLNSTEWAQMQGWHNQMMAQGAMGPGNAWLNGTSATWPGQFTAFQSQTGSSLLEEGWTSGAIVTVRLEGDGSAYNGNSIHVMVFPLTS